MKPLTFGSLFAGIGGFDLGFERAGMVCKWQVEIDERCQQVLARHWPDVKRYGDVRDVGERNLETVDVICGGFPCQDVSVAGRREGLAGERSGLWFEFIRVVEELEPEWVIVENVPGLLSSNGGRDFDTILRGLAQCGYWWAYRVLDLQYFGVPQRRRRVFIVASLTRGRPQQVLFERQSSPWDLAPGREAGEGVTGPATDGTNGYSETGQGWWGNGVAPLRAEGENRPSRPSSLVWQKRGGFGVSEYDNISPTLQHEGGTHQGGPERVPMVAQAVSENQRAEIRLTEYSRQITSGGGKPGQGYPAVLCIRTGGDYDDPYIKIDDKAFLAANPMSDRQMAVSNGYGVRRLTPIECERLQGFPDGHTDGQSDSARYRQLGNAVGVPKATWLGRRLVEVA